MYMKIITKAFPLLVLIFLILFIFSGIGMVIFWDIEINPLPDVFP